MTLHVRGPEIVCGQCKGRVPIPVGTMSIREFQRQLGLILREHEECAAEQLSMKVLLAEAKL